MVSLRSIRVPSLTPQVSDLQTLKQRFLTLRPLALVEPSFLGLKLEREQLRPDPVLVVGLALSLLGDLSGHPGDTSHGRQGEGQKAGEDAHSRGSMSNRTNEC